jgi:biopolymer transport protein ExbD
MGASIADTDLDDDSDFSETHEINVTPFIDVILVLLIIFMVAAPLSTVDLPVDLPSSTAIPQKKPDKPTYVTIKADLAVAIGENMVKRVDLVRSLDAMDNSDKDRFIFLRADRAVPYGDMMDVLEILRAGGYAKIKLVALEGVPDSALLPAAAGDSKPLTPKP